MNKDQVIAELERFNVSRDTIMRLEAYEAEIRKWNSRINLIAPSTLPDLWQRHFLDSLQIAAMIELSPGSKWLDIGSGGGFPALPLAAHFSDTSFTLVESDQRKCSFLRKVAREMGVNVTIIDGRIEAIPLQSSDVISARALAPLDQLLKWARPHANPDATFLFPKGKNWQSELTLAQENWQMDVKAISSRTDSEAHILRIKGLENK